MPPTADISNFTEEQKRLFSQAASLGSGVKTNLGGGITTVLGGNQVLNSSNLTSQPEIQVPPPQVDNTNYQGLVSGGQSTINSLTPASQTQQTPQPSSLDNLFAQYLGAQSADTTPTGSSVYSSLESKANISAKEEAARQAAIAEQQAQQEFDAYNAQLQGFAAEAQAIPIQAQQDATGRGITAGGLAPITNAKLRENALRALPVQAAALAAQAKLASAQGKTALAEKVLNMAQDRVDKIYSIQMQDIQNAYTRRTELRKQIFDFASSQEKTKLEAQQKQADRDFQLQQNYLDNAQAMATEAVKNGQAGLASKITALNPKSPTFVSDLAKLQGQFIAKTVEAPTVKTINGVDMQWNPASKTWEPIAGGGLADPGKGKAQTQLVLNSIQNAQKLVHASGRSGLRKYVEGQLVGSTDYTNLVAETNTLRTNVLTMMTDPAIKKFFGPQMSNADVQLMTSAGTTLNPELQSPEAMKTELLRLADLGERAQMSLDGVTQFMKTDDKSKVPGIRVGAYPDGTIRDAYGNFYDANGNKIK